MEPWRESLALEWEEPLEPFGGHPSAVAINKAWPEVGAAATALAKNRGGERSYGHCAAEATTPRISSSRWAI